MNKFAPNLRIRKSSSFSNFSPCDGGVEGEIQREIKIRISIVLVKDCFKHEKHKGLIYSRDISFSSS